MLKVIRSMRELPLEQLERIYGETLDVDYLRYEFFCVSGAAYCLWLVDSLCVSAARLEPWRDGMLLTALETAPDRRNRGYACALVRAVQAFLREQGSIRIYSHIHHRNAASIRVHEKCCFRKISDTAVYLDGSVVSHSGTYLLEC